jgi:hypothetical protein
VKFAKIVFRIAGAWGVLFVIAFIKTPYAPDAHS